MRDNRLLGAWKSDARLTLRELRARRDLSPKAQQAIGKFFGKLQLRFTSTRIYLTLNGETWDEAYVIVAKDSSSVVTVSHDLLLGIDTISHIHFEGSRFWIIVGSGLFREFFKRIESAKRTSVVTVRSKRRRRSTSGASRVRRLPTKG